jgi:pyruvate/2-oxoglutarate/acetoin dehydrogenase E1 component
VATLDVPVPYSPPLEEYIGPREDRIIEAIRTVLR